MAGTRKACRCTGCAVRRAVDAAKSKHARLREKLEEYSEATAAANVEDTVARHRSKDAAYDRLAYAAVNALPSLLDELDALRAGHAELFRLAVQVVIAADVHEGIRRSNPALDELATYLIREEAK